MTVTEILVTIAVAQARRMAEDPQITGFGAYIHHEQTVLDRDQGKPWRAEAIAIEFRARPLVFARHERVVRVLHSIEALDRGGDRLIGWIVENAAAQLADNTLRSAPYVHVFEAAGPQGQTVDVCIECGRPAADPVHAVPCPVRSVPR